MSDEKSGNGGPQTPRRIDVRVDDETDQPKAHRIDIVEERPYHVPRDAAQIAANCAWQAEKVAHEVSAKLDDVIREQSYTKTRLGRIEEAIDSLDMRVGGSEQWLKGIAKATNASKTMSGSYRLSLPPARLKLDSVSLEPFKDGKTSSGETEFKFTKEQLKDFVSKEIQDSQERAKLELDAAPKRWIEKFIWPAIAAAAILGILKTIWDNITNHVHK